MITGGCYCGLIRYAAEGEPADETNCHCSICRRTSGAPFITWFTVRRSLFRFVSGTPAEFQSTERGVRRFCPRCGTHLTFENAASPDEVDISTCSLDDPNGIPPKDNTYTSSKLRWIRLDDGLPSYPQAHDPAVGAAKPFQPEPGVIRWKMCFRSPPETVYRALATPEGRNRFWAESANENAGVIEFHLPGGLRESGRILESVPGRRFTAEYFGWTVSFDLESAAGGAGTDLEMTCRGISDSERTEVIAGWVSVLMAMKAAVDYDVDLRNHDPERTWWHGYADN